MLSIVVCLKITVDTAQLAADTGTGAPLLDGAALRSSTFDENALEEAVRLKDQSGGAVRVLLLVPAPPPRELLLKALAMGADEAYVIVDEGAAAADSLATAGILAAGLEKLRADILDGREGDQAWDLVLCGEGSMDGYERQVGPRLAEALGIPSLTHVTHLEVVAEEIVATRTTDERIEELAARVPALLTVGSEINDPRLPTVLQIMGASSKAIVEWTLQDLGFPAGATAADMSAIETIEIRVPSAKRKCRTVGGESHDETAKALYRLLCEEGVL